MTRPTRWNRWGPRDASGEPEGLILFDGVCVFCSRWVRFVIRHDRERRFTFTPIQSARGRTLAALFGIDPEAPQTNAVILDGRVWFKSDAALTVLAAMPATRGLGILKAAPRTVRDFAYDRIARNRYLIFGRTETCMVPGPEDRARFVE